MTAILLKDSAFFWHILEPVNSKHPLIEVSEHVRDEAQRSRVAVIFDLDSTLFNVSSRTQHILRELGKDNEFRNRFATVAEILRDIEILPVEYSVRQVLARRSVESSPELTAAIKAYWSRYFFSNTFLDKDGLYPSANEYVRHLHALGAHILYLTGREDKRMREGTVRVLRQWGFPEFDDSRLLMKASSEELDEHFKVTVLKRLVHEFDHIWFFENEPLIIRDVRALLPQIHIVYVNSAHSGKAPPPEGLRTVLPDYTAGIPSK